MKNELKSIVLKDCPYSIALRELLTNYNILSTYIKVDQKTKYKYKTDKIDTFPQVYINDVLIGGYNDTKEIIDLINTRNLTKIKKGLKTKYPNLNEKNILRIIQLFIPHSK